MVHTPPKKMVITESLNVQNKVSVLNMCGEVLLGPRIWIIPVKAEGKFLQPCEHVLDILLRLLRRNHTFDNHETIAKEIISPVVIFLTGVNRIRVNRVRHLESLQRCEYIYIF